MTMTLRCGDVMPGCPAEVRADTEEEVMRQAVEHVHQDHGMTDLDEVTTERVRSAIRTE